ncbi:MAG: 2Fe-2S iron-sulfur cluster-binding protein [Steroidobacteraceae bacterium]|jgi:NADH-quinone oxidoreductase subunit G|nr:2Fe-2S iron-sulfur cluster-binding protein [Steroidobacteraceae bacterium]
MPTIYIDGRPVEAAEDQTVMQAARAAGVEIPHFCWHPALSVPGNCRICMVEVEGKGTDIACNMPVKAGMKVFTNSDEVVAHRKAILQLTLLNHPVDCGICDKAGECTLQDYHYRYNGEPSVSVDAKVPATKFNELSDRIVLDNERCILCSRCVRFTREVSGSNGLGIEHRADHSRVQPSSDGAFRGDPYSDNVVDLCPVGALLSRRFLYRSRVWYLEPTPSVCPGCERGCTINVWHRLEDWKLKSVATKENSRIARVTPLENPAVNGPWICNKGRDLADLFERPRTTQAKVGGRPAEIDEAVAAARRLIATATRPVALVSSWGSNEELEAFARHLGGRLACFVKADHRPREGEVLEDGLLIKAGKNPNSRRARELFGDAAPSFAPGTDLVLCWGEGFDPALLPAGAKLIVIGSFFDAATDRADVLLPASTQLERDGHYTNFEGVVSAFAACFPRPAGVADAEALFGLLAGEDAT